MSNINDYQLSSESDELDHPNIDKKSLIEYKRNQKIHNRHEMQSRLNFLLKTGGDPDEIKKLQFKLSEKISSTDENLIINNEEHVDDDIIHHLEYLLNNNGALEFIKYMDDYKINLELLEMNTLYNLAECIKSGRDDIGMEFARLVMYIKWAREGGRNMMRKVAESQTDAVKSAEIENEWSLYYEKAKIELIKNKNLE